MYTISRLDYPKSKNQNNFVNIMYYLLINRRNKQNNNFLRTGAFSKKISIFYQNFSLKLFKMENIDWFEKDFD